MHKIVDSWRHTIMHYKKKDGNVHFICDKRDYRQECKASDAYEEFKLPKDKNGC